MGGKGGRLFCFIESYPRFARHFRSTACISWVGKSWITSTSNLVSFSTFHCCSNSAGIECAPLVRSDSLAPGLVKLNFARFPCHLILAGRVLFYTQMNNTKALTITNAKRQFNSRLQVHAHDSITKTSQALFRFNLISVELLLWIQHISPLSE